jgi:hypothetical protein
MHVLASVLAWGSSVINPFIYAFSNRQYGNAFQKLLCCKHSNLASSMTGGVPAALRHQQSCTPSQSGRTLMTECANTPGGGQVNRGLGILVYAEQDVNKLALRYLNISDQIYCRYSIKPTYAVAGLITVLMKKHNLVNSKKKAVM